MKKLFASVFLIALCMCCLSSCGDYEENGWFSEENLENCLVPDLPQLEKSFIGNGDDVYVSLSSAQFDDYARAVYDYLRSREFAYLGTRGEQKSSFKGLFTTYYFEPAEKLDDFLVNGDYIFVYSDGTLDEASGNDPIFCIVAIRYCGKSTIEYKRNKTFTYTTKISIRYGSESPVGGSYSLPDEKLGDFLSGYERWLSELTPQKVAEIKTTHTAVGVPPGRLKDVTRTTDKSVISDIINHYARVAMTPITREEAEIDGGSSTEVEFTLTDGTVSVLSFNNGNYACPGATEGESPLYFKLDSIYTPTSQDGVNSFYSFVTYSGSGTVYSNDVQVCEIRVDELEFVELKEKIGLPSWIMYVVETEFGDLIFQTEDIFHIDGDDTYYRLTGESLDLLIQKATCE